MSRGQDFARFNAGARTFLEPDIGPIEDEDCSACDSPAVYRVPWPSVGDVAYCSYHLARYRELHPKLWNRVDQAVDEDLSALATRGDRFLTFCDVPETLFGDDFHAIALLADGRALYCEREPEGTVTYRAVHPSLEVTAERELDLEDEQAFLQWVEHEFGVHHWATGGEVR